MGNKRITDLTPITVPTGLSVMPIVHQGATRQITLDNLFTYVDNYYFKSGKAPSVTDNLGNAYNQFKTISGNFLVSGSNIVRVSTGVFRVDNSGVFDNYLSGRNVYIDNLYVSGLNLSGGSVQGDLTILGNLRVSGDLTTLSTDFEIEDKNITFASIPSGLLNNSGLDGAGFTVKGLDSDKKITWYNTDVNFDLKPDFSGTWQVDQNFQVEKKLRTSGTATFDSGIYITNSNFNNPLKFGSNINVHATGANFDVLAIDQHGYVHKDLTINDNLYVRDNLDVSGNSIRLLGDVTLGTSASNSITFLGGFVQDIKPVNDWVNEFSSPFQNLGISNKRWREVWAGRGIFHDAVNITGVLRLTGDAFITGSTILGQGQSENLTVNATPTFTSEQVFIQNNLNTSGNLNVSGNTILGDAVSDNLIVNSRIASNLVPNLNNTRNLGATGLYWNEEYINTSFINQSNISGGLHVGGDANITGAVNVSGNALFNNAVSIRGNTTLGDNSAVDTTTFNSRVNTNIEPSLDNTYNLGAANRRWASLRASTVDASSALNVSGNTILGDAISDTVTLNASINSNIIPNSTNTRDLGSTTTLWNNVYTNNLNISGNTILGDSISDRISFVGYVNTDIDPETNNARDLGANNLFWRNAYLGNLFNSGTLTTIQSGINIPALSITGNAITGLNGVSGYNYTGLYLSIADNSLSNRNINRLVDIRGGASGVLPKFIIFNTGTSVLNTALGLGGNLLVTGSASATSTITAAGLITTSNNYVLWNPGTYVYAEAAGLLSQRNGTNPQQFRVFNTTGTNTGEFGLFGWRSGQLIIGAQQHHSGILRDVILTGNNIYINSPNTDVVSGSLRLSGNLVATENNLITTGINLTNAINSLSESTNTFLRLDSTSQSIFGSKFFLGDVTINNLTITGTQSVVSSNDFTVRSNFITINSGESGNAGISLVSGGLRIDRGTGTAFPDAFLIYNELTKRFEFGTEGNLSGIAPIETLNTTINNLAITGSSLSIATGILNSRLSDLSGTLTADYVTLATSQNIGGAKNFTTRPQFNNNDLVIISDLANQSNLVFTTGDQTISGEKQFSTRPKVNGTGVLLQNEATRLDNVVFQTGAQFISGLKNFELTPTVNGIPLVVSGLGLSLSIQTQNVTIPNGSIQEDIPYITPYGIGTKPTVIGNLYATGTQEEVIPFQIQNISNTGFRLSIAYPATGYNFSFVSFENTGLNFIAQGPPGPNVFNQKIQLNTGVISQQVNFNTTFSSLPTLSLQLEDRNNPINDSFFLYRVTGLSTSSFFINLSNPIPAPFSGYYMHVIAATQ